MRRSRRRALGLFLAGASGMTFSRPVRAGLGKPEMVKLLTVIDDRQRNDGDWRALAFMEQKRRNMVDVVYEVLFYRRNRDQKFMVLFTKPKTAQGQGYLRMDRNLWFYDPAVGKWERRTERERLAGTNSRRSDFDESRLSEEYDPQYLGEEKLGSYPAVVIGLQGKPGLDLAFPRMKLWVDRATNNPLKRQEFSLSGKLLRSSYYLKWSNRHSESKRADVWYPQEMRFYDEVEKQNETLIVFKSIDFNALDVNLFTKAWLESKSR
jgi:outer membrane lipoprotein-sorting protein